MVEIATRPHVVKSSWERTWFRIKGKDNSGYVLRPRNLIISPNVCVHTHILNLIRILHSFSREFNYFVYNNLDNKY